MDRDELLARYEALGEEGDFLAAKPLFEQALRQQPTALLHRQYGYLLECHGRRAIGRAMQQYERSIELDPSADKARYQWMIAKAALRQEDDAVALYRDRAAASPGDVRELRFLSSAHLLANDFAAAAQVIGTGLELAPGDWKLTYDRGEVKAVTGDPDGALADWRRAHELNPEDLGPVYASAFLAEREGRLAEAAGSWQYILDFSVARGWELDAVWPRQEIERLRGLLAGREHPGG